MFHFVGANKATLSLNYQLLHIMVHIHGTVEEGIAAAILHILGKEILNTRAPCPCSTANAVCMHLY